MAEVKVIVRQTGVSTAEAEVRTHRVLIDRPEAKGGADKGAMGGEILLAGLGGCFMSNLLAAIKARDIKASEILVDVVGILDAAPPRFSAIHMTISGNYPDRVEMERLVSMSDKACIVANTIRSSVKLTITVQDS